MRKHQDLCTVCGFSAVIVKQAPQQGNPLFWEAGEGIDIHVLLSYFALMFGILVSYCDKNRVRLSVFASLVLQQTLLSILIYEDSTPSVCFVIFPKFQFLTALHERGSLGSILKRHQWQFQ